MASFQPKVVTTTNVYDVESSGLIYKATVNDPNNSYSIGDLVEVQTRTDAQGTTTTQYFNLTKQSNIAAANFNEANFSIVGGSTTATTVAMKLDSFEFLTLSDANGQLPFTLAQAVDSVGKIIPVGTTYVELEMQLRVGTENDFFLFTTGTASPSISPQVGQPKQEVQLRNVAEIGDAQFLGVPAVVGNQVKLIATFWSANPN